MLVIVLVAKRLLLSPIICMEDTISFLTGVDYGLRIIDCINLPMLFLISYTKISKSTLYFKQNKKIVFLSLVTLITLLCRHPPQYLQAELFHYDLLYSLV